MKCFVPNRHDIWCLEPEEMDGHCNSEVWTYACICEAVLIHFWMVTSNHHSSDVALICPNTCIYANKMMDQTHMARQK